MLLLIIMNYFVLLQQIFILFFVAAMGFIGAKCRILPEEGRKCISKLVLYITLPAMILASVKDVPAGFAVSDLLFHYFSVAVELRHYGYTGLLCAKAASGSQGRIRGLRISGAFRQCGLYGFSGAYGSFRQRDHFHCGHFQSADEYHLLYRWRINDCPQRNENLRSLRAPAVISSIAPLLYLFHITLPDVVNEAFSTIEDYRTSGDDDHRTHPSPGCPSGISGITFKLYLVSAIRLLVCPIVIFFLFRLFISDPVLLGTSVLLARDAGSSEYYPLLH